MQAITFPEAVSTAVVHQTLLEVAWRLLTKHELTRESFVEMISLNAPDNGAATLFIDAVNMAITEDAIFLARQLTNRALQQFPEDRALLHYREVLAPPKVIGTRPASHDFSKSMRWLSAHSHEYVGQWLALEDGVLLGTAKSRKALVEQLGSHAEADNVLLTRVPAT